MRFNGLAAVFLLLAGPLDAQAPAPVLPPALTWPAERPLETVRAPDWSDYRLYPPEARRRGHEGTVTVEAWIGKDGIPRECRAHRSSGHADLDLGTCALILRMRFAPPRDSSGQVAEATFRKTFSWLLSGPTKLGPARLTAELLLDQGRVTSCLLTRTGPVPRIWPRLACRTFAQDSEYYLGPQRLGARKATVLLELRPTVGPPLEAAPAHGRLVASRAIRFRLNRKGDPVDCTGLREEGFGRPRIYEDPACGLFLIQSWIKPGRPPTGTDTALFEMKVLLDEE
jgi:TonB family protein